MSLVGIKDFNVLLENKPFFNQPVKNKQEPYEKHFEMPRNNDYIIGKVLAYLYYQNYYKLVGIDLSRQKKHRCPSAN